VKMSENAAELFIFFRPNFIALVVLPQLAA
jgi:hypothetical protein